MGSGEVRFLNSYFSLGTFSLNNEKEIEGILPLTCIISRETKNNNKNKITTSSSVDGGSRLVRLSIRSGSSHLSQPLQQPINLEDTI